MLNRGEVFSARHLRIIFRISSAKTFLLASHTYSIKSLLPPVSLRVNPAPRIIWWSSELLTEALTGLPLCRREMVLITCCCGRGESWLSWNRIWREHWKPHWASFRWFTVLCLHRLTCFPSTLPSQAWERLEKQQCSGITNLHPSSLDFVVAGFIGTVYPPKLFWCETSEFS